MALLTTPSQTAPTPLGSVRDLDPDIPAARTYRSTANCPQCGDPRTLQVMDADREVRLTCANCMGCI